MNRCTKGFTYLGLLFLIAFVGIGLSAVGSLTSTLAQRNNEKQLLFVGGQIRSAIRSYYERAPVGARTYPRSLNDLMEDERFSRTARHLRKIYPDPFTGVPDWELLTLANNSLVGVVSRSEKIPLKQNNFTVVNQTFKNSDCYCQWRFTYLPQLQNGDQNPNAR